VLLRRRPARPAEYTSRPMILIPARAKVNLCLAVRGRRADGFHDIDSVAVTIDWHDLVGVRLRASEATAVRLLLTGNDGSAPDGDDNLAVLAARAVAAVTGPVDVDLWVDKSIPSAAGLGGGSADAAGVLRGCASLVSAGALGARRAALIDDAELVRLAASVGSDVPMLLRGGAQRMRGRGEALTGLPAAVLHLAVAIVGASSTAATYAAVARTDFEDGARIDAVAAALAGGDRLDDDCLGSGLEAAACRASPVLEGRLDALRSALPDVRWHLTGSGGAAFAITDTSAAADRVATAALRRGFPARACRSVAG
jgi:4-diphosphocytidyl-2-C-methyl-D-erythritol kinase